MHTTGKHHNVFYVCASNILLFATQSGQRRRTMENIQAASACVSLCWFKSTMFSLLGTTVWLNGKMLLRVVILCY